MSRLLEILGRALDVSTADLIWHWLDTVKGSGVGHQTENTACGSAASIVEKDFNQIIELIGKKELASAEEKLRFHLFENPACVKGRMAAAAICLHKNRLHDAVESLQSIYLRQPGNTMALYALGHCHERLGNEAESVEFYQDCLKFKRYLQLPRYRLAAVYFKNGQIEKTIRQYEVLTDEYPDDVMHPDKFQQEEYDNEIEMLLWENKITEALEQVQLQLEEQGQTADLYIKLADLLTLAGQDAEAILQYEKAVETQPNSLVAVIKLGTCHLRAGRQLAAAQCFTRAVEINDRIVEAYLGLAAAQKLAGSFEQACRTLSLAWAIQQNSTLLFGNAATLQFATTLDDLHTPAGSWQDSFRQVQFHKLIEQVIRAHESQLAQSPHDAEAQYRYGLLLMCAAKPAEAAAAFEAAVQANPTYHRARGKLVICLCEAVSKNKAMHWLTGTQPIAKQILELHYKTALLYCDRGRFSSAIANVQESLRASLTDFDAATNISVVLQNLGLVDRAAATWRCLRETARHAMSGLD